MTTQAELSKILYLNAASLDSLGLELSDIVDILDDMFRLKAEGHTIMPPKIFFHTGPVRIE